MTGAGETGGVRAWHVPDCFIPDGGDSHESICLTNATDVDAELVVTAYFSDREPTTVDGVRVGARRNRHLRTDAPELAGLGLRPGVPYGLRIECGTPIAVQYSRLDETNPRATLMTSMVC